MPLTVLVLKIPITHVLMVSTTTLLTQLASIVKTVPCTAPQPMLLNVWQTILGCKKPLDAVTSVSQTALLDKTDAQNVEKKPTTARPAITSTFSTDSVELVLDSVLLSHVLLREHTTSSLTVSDAWPVIWDVEPVIIMRKIVQLVLKEQQELCKMNKMPPVYLPASAQDPTDSSFLTIQFSLSLSVYSLLLSSLLLTSCADQETIKMDTSIRCPIQIIKEKTL
jgi:hypothetical protein